MCIRDREIIIINDGSIDESGKILRKLAQKDSRIILLEQENKQNRKRIKQLENLCKEKDSFFMELMADGLRHGSSLAAKHMSDRKKYKQGYKQGK